MVPEPADEAQKAAAEGAGRAEDARRRGAIRGQLERERTERQERAGRAEARTGAGLVPAGGQRRGRGRCGHRGRHLLPGPSTIVGAAGCTSPADPRNTRCGPADFLQLSV